MSGISIGINVDARQIAAAKASIDQTKDALQHLSDPVELAGKTGLKDTSVLVKQLAADINRLKNISTASDRQGGLLNAKQFSESAIVYAKLGKNMQEFAAQTAKAAARLDELKDKLRQVQKDSAKASSPSDTRRYDEQVKELEREVTRGQKRYDRLYDNERLMRAQSDDYSSDIVNAEQQKQQTSGVFGGGGIKKALGYGAALLGGFSLMSFLQDSIGKAGAMDVARADLGKRGGNYGFGAGAGLGFSPIEEAMLADGLNRQTGWSGKSLESGNKTAMQFGRTFGIEGEIAAGFMGGTKKATGISESEYKSYMKSINTIAHSNVEEGRVGEFLDVNKQLLTSMSSARGGAGVGKETMDFIAKLQGHLWSQGSIGQSGNAIGGLSSGISSGGSSKGQEVFLYNALKGKKDGLEGYLEYMETLQEGASPENIRKILNQQAQTGRTTRADYQAAIMSLQGNKRDAKSAGLLADEFMGGAKQYGQTMLDYTSAGGAFRQNYKATSETELATGDASEFRRVNAGMDNTKVAVGGKILPLVTKFKDAASGSVDKILEGEYLKAIDRFTTDNPLGNIGLALGGGAALSKLMPDFDVGFGGGKNGKPGSGVATAAKGAALWQGLKTGVKYGTKAVAKAGPLAVIGEAVFPTEMGTVPQENYYDKIVKPAEKAGKQPAMTQTEYVTGIEKGTIDEYGRSKSEQDKGPSELGGLAEAIWALVGQLQVMAGGH